MEARAKVLPKYQITIPKKVREKLGLKQGDVVFFEPLGEKGFLLRKGPSLDALKGTLSPPAGLSPEEAIEKAIELAVEEDMKSE